MEPYIIDAWLIGRVILLFQFIQPKNEGLKDFNFEIIEEFSTKDDDAGGGGIAQR